MLVLLFIRRRQNEKRGSLLLFCLSVRTAYYYEENRMIFSQQ